MSEPAANGGDPGAWGAVTDPVGQRSDPRPERQAPASAPADGAELPGSAPADARSSDQARTLDRAPDRAASRGTIRDVSSPPRPRRAASSRPASPGGDLLTDLQRWVIRSGAKSMRREIEGSVRRTLGGGRPKPEDIWGTATTEPPPGAGESPECLWCPICRAARKMRESSPGLSSQISGASDVVATAVQDAIVAVDSVLSRATAAPAQQPRAPRPEPLAPRPEPGVPRPEPGASRPEPGASRPEPGASRPEPPQAPRPQPPANSSSGSGHADSASDEAERAADEPGDRG